MTIYNKLKKNDFLSAIRAVYLRYFAVTRSKFGYIHPTAWYRQPIMIKGIKNVYLHENTSILGNALILTVLAKFIVKKNTGIAEGLTVITGNHVSPIGRWHRFVDDTEKPGNADKDVVIEEDVWIGANVTLLSGVTIKRGAIVGAGSVCRFSSPPYSIVAGNPAKVIGFKFTPSEIIKHEKALYPEDERLSLDELNKNYRKYYCKRVKEIVNFLK
ncbi:DapH/DapD/GlmU-related protein [uncultured Draconibacterium sp.]|uniref:DapH/DapD/GlmU-related protein n=1 Tax=uncultured Draconibacterium sp. TaxID=1573823 RepID=UPI0029C83671|nr:DapH/DapD/GlmU-related protein [uncultured Draconibacterium sp.]